MRTRWGSGKVAVWSSLTCGVLLLLAPAGATAYHSTKLIFYDITDPATGGILPGNGMYRFTNHAFAQDKHGKDHDDTPAPGTDFFIKLADHLKDFGAVFQDKVVDGNHFWPSFTPFDQTVPHVFVAPGAAALTTHGESVSNGQIDYDPTLGIPTLQVAETRIALDGSANIINLPLHPPETAYAEADSGAQVMLHGAKINRAQVSSGKGPVIRLNVKNLGTTVTSSGFVGAVRDTNPDPDIGNTANRSYVRDPIDLSLFDSVTGSLLAEQTLFTDLFLAEGNATSSYDPTAGFTLTADKNGLASFVLDMTSSWILNPMQGGVMIDNGVFSATGDFAALPWALSSAGGVMTATLSPADLSLDLDLMIQPTGLGTPANDLLPVFTDNENGFANDYATVPEAPAWLLLLTALFGFVLIRRRHAQ